MAKTYHVDVIEADDIENKVVLRINSKRYEFLIKDKYADLLEQLGMDMSLADKVSEIKAPMPGLVLDIFSQSR